MMYVVFTLGKGLAFKGYTYGNIAKIRAEAESKPRHDTAVTAGYKTLATVEHGACRLCSAGSGAKSAPRQR